MKRIFNFIIMIFYTIPVKIFLLPVTDSFLSKIANTFQGKIFQIILNVLNFIASTRLKPLHAQSLGSTFNIP